MSQLVISLYDGRYEVMPVRIGFRSCECVMIYEFLLLHKCTATSHIIQAGYWYKQVSGSFRKAPSEPVAKAASLMNPQRFWRSWSSGSEDAQLEQQHRILWRMAMGSPENEDFSKMGAVGRCTARWRRMACASTSPSARHNMHSVVM